MKTFRVTHPVAVMSRRFTRSFEQDETRVTEAEIELAVEHFRRCFEENPPEKPAEG